MARAFAEPGLIPVCWSLRSERANHGFGPGTQVHLARDDGRTACGKPTGDLWDFWAHDLEDGDIGPTCKRCMASALWRKLAAGHGTKAA